MELSNFPKIIRANALVLSLLFIPVTARAGTMDGSTRLSSAKTEVGVCNVQGDCYGSIFIDSFMDGNCAVTMTTGCDCNGNCCTVTILICPGEISVDLGLCP